MYPEYPNREIRVVVVSPVRLVARLILAAIMLMAALMPRASAGPLELTDDKTLPGDSLLLPSQTVYGGLGVQPVVTKLAAAIRGATIPIAIPSGIEVVELSTAGLVTEDWNLAILDIEADSGYLFIALANTFGAIIPVGETNVCNIRFLTGNNSCEQSFSFRWDTTLSGSISRRLTYSSLESSSIRPGFGYFRDRVDVLPVVPGDVNSDGVVAIEDLTYFIAFMFRGGLPPGSLNSADVNGDCLGPDIRDLVTMIDHLFKAGPPLRCGCIE